MDVNVKIKHLTVFKNELIILFLCIQVEGEKDRNRSHQQQVAENM